MRRHLADVVLFLLGFILSEGCTGHPSLGSWCANVGLLVSVVQCAATTRVQELLTVRALAGPRPP